MMLTAFQDNDSLDLPSVDALVDFYLAAGPGLSK
jgi:dihydrodipicolinate synthase/N-acetylneuraminate lyase